MLYSDRMSNYPHKLDYLREFRKYPSTVLLGVFCYMRTAKEDKEDL